MDISSIHAEIDACHRCKSLEPNFAFSLNKVIGIQRGNPRAIVMGIGIAPGRSAAQDGLAFAGNSFTTIRKWFGSVGYQMDETSLREKLYLTSLNKCATDPDSQKVRAKLWENCNRFLWQQVEIVKPKLVLLFGSEVSSKLTLFSKSGVILKVGAVSNMQDLFSGDLFPPTTANPRVLAMPHPSGLSRTMNDEAVRGHVLAALKRELIEASFGVEGDS